MGGSVIDRRKESRATGDAVRQISARIRPGLMVLLVDVSPCGALIAGARPLRPGARIEVQLERDADSSSLGARVVRCLVAAVTPDQVTYHAALAFEKRCEWVDETQGGHSVPMTREPI